MADEADGAPGIAQQSAEHASALQRGLALRIAIALILLALVVFAMFVTKGGGSGSDVTAPVSATTPPLPITQSPAPSARGEEKTPASPPAPAIEPSHPQTTASATPATASGSPAAASEPSGSHEVAAAPAPSGAGQGPDAPVKETPPSPSVPAGVTKSEPHAARQSAGNEAASTLPPAAKVERPEPPAAQPADTQAAKPPRGPRLQAGVFAQASNAQALKAKLEAHGFPVIIESRGHAGQSRVHVGPFKDRKEAERARDKLQELGVTTVLIAQ